MNLVVDSGLRDGRWRVDPGFGIYVHIPFCLHRCHYCDFNTYEGQEELHGAYVDALVRQIETASIPSPEVTSVFFGGGTPTLLPPRALGRVLQAIGSRFVVAPDAEVTVEANPETVDQARLEELRVAGFNRISIGIQSLAPAVLERLGRVHSAERALTAVAAARAAGFADVNVDLIYGSPWETPRDWQTSLEGVLAADPDHVSAYALTVEEGTPLATMVRTGRVADVDPDVQAARHELADDVLSTAGFRHYEISNWSRPDRASRHNVLYWSAGDYLGFGAGAHGHVAGRRWWNVRLPRDFIAAAAACSTEAGSETSSPVQRSGEALMLGLRLSSGIHVPGFLWRFGDDALDGREALVAQLEAVGLLERHDEWLRLSPRGAAVANDVLCRLL